MRRAAAGALTSLGSDVVPHLSLAVADPDEDIRWAAARILGAVGTHASTTFAPILTSFSLCVVSDQCSACSGSAHDRFGSNAACSYSDLSGRTWTSSGHSALYLPNQ